MNQVLEVILETFKKANKKAREKMAEKYGFRTPEQFEKYLTDPASNPDPPLPTPRVRVVKKSKVKEPKEVPTDMVIAFDTTGSMKAYIADVRKHVEKTINEMFDTLPNLKLKIVAFGDYCDMKSSTEFGKAYQQIELTNDRAKLIQFVQDAKDTGGGDMDEFYELVLHRVIYETPWREGSNRAILLIGDCDPHPVGYSLSPFVKNAQYNWKTEAAVATVKNIKVDTLRIHPNTSWYAELSKMTNGSCMNFQSSHKTADLVIGATYLNSKTKAGIEKARALYKTAVESHDTELVGAYKGMAASRGIDLDD